MRKIIFLSIALMVFMPLASHAFPLSFKYIMCTVDEDALKDEVYDLAKKWERTQRRYAPGSQYYKHVKRHIKEATDAINEAMVDDKCSPERKVVLEELKRELQAVS